MIENFGFVHNDGIDLSFLEERSRLTTKSLESWYPRVVGGIGKEADDDYLLIRPTSKVARDRIRFSFPLTVFVTPATLRGLL